jgi:alpha-glucoside transport system permease protein
VLVGKSAMVRALWNGLGSSGLASEGPRGATVATHSASDDRSDDLGPVAERLVGSSRTLLVLAIVGLWLLPTVGAVITSLRVGGRTQLSGWWTDLLDPSTWTLDAYRAALSSSANNSFAEAMFNSFAIAIPATVIPILIASLAAYALAWIPFKGHGVALGSIVALIAVPIHAVLIPHLQAYSSGAHLTVPAIDKTVTLFPDLNLAVTLPAVWLTHIGAALPFSIFLLVYAMARLPRSLIDSARVDGASDMQVYWRVVVPLSAPVLAALGVLLFVWSWNDFVIALTMIGGGNPSALPVTVKLGSFGGADEGPVILAGLIIHASVSVAVFLGLQRYFEQGLLAGVE